MVPAGSFKHLFKLVGVIYINTTDKNADDLEMAAIDAGALDTIFQAEYLQIFTEPKDLKKVKEALEKKNISVENANLIYTPLDPIEIDQDAKFDYENILEKLDELDDIQEIYDNL
jgi:transcriptional/translational regulatory protein YebC/TACO1